MIRFIGDIHGDLNYYFSVVKNSPCNTIQLGDFGIGFLTEHQEDSLRNFWKEREEKGYIDRFIRGNHDDPNRCLKFPSNFISDGSILNFSNYSILCVGGAYSIDRQFRTLGVDYWHDEECSLRKFSEILENVSSMEKKPTIILSHDAPDHISYEMFISNGDSLLGNQKIATLTSFALKEIANVVQPKFHFFGHWHLSRSLIRDNTNYICVGVNDFYDFSEEFYESV